MAEKAKSKKAKSTAKKAPTRTKKVSESMAESSEEMVARKNVKKPATAARLRDDRKAHDEELDSADFEDGLPPLEQKFAAPMEDSRDTQPPSSFIVPRLNSTVKAEPEAEELKVRLSRSLIRKLREQAADEGITFEEFVTELLSESVVLRAWEIVERKNQMKGGNAPALGQNRSHGNSNSAGGNNNSNNNRGHRGHKGQRGMSHMRYQSIMEDKGAFLEYVRSQERNRR
jgi:hypothetical protein